MNSIPNFRLACRQALPTSLNFTKHAYIWRSGHLKALASSDLSVMRNKLKIEVNLDLRTRAEVSKSNVSRLLMMNNIKQHHFPLSQETNTLRSIKYPSYFDYYRYYHELITMNSSMIKKIIQFLAESKHKRFLINCHAGKDRTGTVIMLIMGALDLDQQIILNDYHLSKKYLINSISYFSESWKKRQMTQADYAKRLASDPRSLKLIMNEITQHHGSLLSYIEHIGISSKELNLLRSKFTEYQSHINMDQ